jgi:hypothetical protein
MPKLSNLAKNKATLKIEFEDEDPLIITYYPGRATDDLFLCYAGFEEFSASTAKETVDGFNGALLSLIKEWNLEDDDNTIIPLTPEGMHRTYWEIKTLIFSKIQLDMSSPNRKPTQD